VPRKELVGRSILDMYPKDKAGTRPLGRMQSYGQDML